MKEKREVPISFRFCLHIHRGFFISMGTFGHIVLIPRPKYQIFLWQVVTRNKTFLDYEEPKTKKESSHGSRLFKAPFKNKGQKMTNNFLEHLSP